MKQFLEWFITIMIIVLSFERILVNDNQITGYYNREIFIALTILTCISFLFINIKEKKFNYLNTKTGIKSTILLFLAALLIISNGINNYSFIYCLALIIIYFSGNTKVINYKMYTVVVLIASIIYTFIDLLVRDAERITGVYATSPTTFSFLLLIIQTVVLFRKDLFSVYWRYAFSIGCTLLIYLTLSRSTFIFSVLLYILILYKNILRRIDFKAIIVIVGFSGMIVAFIVLFMSTFDLFFTLRSDGVESNTTRQSLYMYAINYFMNMGVSKQLLGLGSGTTISVIILEFFGRITDLPLHQDIIVIMIEQGIVGILLILMYLKYTAKRWSKLVITLFVVGSFHNMITSPIVLFLLIQANYYLTQEGDKYEN